MIYIKDKEAKNAQVQDWAVFKLGEKGSWLEFKGSAAGPALEKQLGPAMPVSRATFNAWRKRHQ